MSVKLINSGEKRMLWSDLEKGEWYIWGPSAFKSGLWIIKSNNYLCFHTGHRNTFIPWFL